MTSSDFRNQALSGFTLALLADSSWYKVDMSLAEPLFWGEGRGADFL